MSESPWADGGVNNLIGLKLRGMQDGHYVVELAVKAHHLSGANKVHSGVYMVMLDTAMARVLREHSTENNNGQVNVELKTNFLRGVESGTLRAEGRVVKLGRRLGFAETTLFGDNSKQLATAAATFMFR